MASVEAGSFWIDQGDAHLRSATTTNSPLNPDRASNDVNSQPTSGQIRAVFSSVADAPTGGGLAPTQTLDPEVLVTPTYLSIDEGGSGRYRIYLRTAPSANVTVVISAGAGVTAYPAEVRFTPTAWRDPQIITVTGLDDTDSNDGRATITHASQDGQRVGVPEPGCAGRAGGDPRRRRRRDQHVAGSNADRRGRFGDDRREPGGSADGGCDDHRDHQRRPVGHD